MAPLSSFHYLKEGINQANQSLIEQGKPPVEVTIVTLNPVIFSQLRNAQKTENITHSGLSANA